VNDGYFYPKLGGLINPVSIILIEKLVCYIVRNSNKIGKI